jgi:hypothetical protein
MLRRFIGPRLLSEDGGGTGAPAPAHPPTGDKPAGTAAAPEKAETPAKVFTPDEVEQIVKDRLARQKTQYEAAEQRRAEDAKAAALKEQGDFKALYEQEQARVATEAKRAADLEAIIASHERTALLRRVAKAAGLDPDDDLVSRLRGETEDELTADAKQLAERLAPPPRGTPPRPGFNAQRPTGAEAPPAPRGPLTRF